MTEEKEQGPQKRVSEMRVRDWTPPDKLSAPTPPDGWSLRFVRYRVRNEDDVENVIERRRQGYEVVTSEEIRSWDGGDSFIYNHIDDASDGGRSGEVRVGDLLLMKIPTRMAQQRTDYYEHSAQALMRAIQSELEGQGTNLAPIMPNESHSSVSFGTGLAGNKDAHPVRFNN